MNSSFPPPCPAHCSTPAKSPTCVPGRETAGHIHGIETCGAVDGPGVRYVVFTHGCPLRCQYCHNPETQGRPDKGQVKTAGEILDDVVRYKPFLRRGGLTVSGGEPLMQPEFVHAILAGAKEQGLHTALDTSGFLGMRASDELLENVDLVLLDIKSGLKDIYRDVTGVALQPTLDFACRLEAMQKPMWVRFVLVPGLTDGEENIEGVAQFVALMDNVERVEILPFHQMGSTKYEAIGKPYSLSHTPTPTPAELAKARMIFDRYGVEAF